MLPHRLNENDRAVGLVIKKTLTEDLSGVGSLVTLKMTATISYSIKAEN